MILHAINIKFAHYLFFNLITTIMTKLKTVICVSLILFFTPFGFGQQLHIIKGTVSDSTLLKAIPFANIALLNQKDSAMIKGTTADDLGAFIFEKIKTDSVLIRYSSVGYATKYQPIVLTTTHLNLGNIMLHPQIAVLAGVEITATRPLYSFDADKKVYNVSEDISMQGGTASDALQNAPGVWVDMEGNITLRGVSGVEIWINGKPSKIKEEGLKTYLQQLPANALDKIEVMTNPSAKYAASGTGGIINIVTKEKIKKNQLFSFGINGSSRPEFSPWVSYVWANEKWNFSSYISHSQNRYTQKSSSNGLVKNNLDTTYTFSNTSESSSDYSWNYGHIGGEYQMDTNNSISVYFGAGYSDGNSNSLSTSNRFMFSENTNYDINSLSSGGNIGFNYNGGISYTHKYNNEGKNLSLDLYTGRWQNTSTSDYQDIYTIQTEKNKKRKSENTNKSGWNSFSLNYENPINDVKSIEAGLSINYNPDKSDSPVDTLNFTTQEWIRSSFLYNKNHGYDIGSEGYFTYSNKIWVLKYKVGARAEYKRGSLISDAMNQTINRDYFNVFPSFYLSYQTKSMHNFSFNYARRVQYPDYQLDPFVDYSNEERIYSGNPNLNEAFTNSFEFGWSKYFKNGSALNINIYHRNTNKLVSKVVFSVFDTILQRTTLFSTFANSGHDIFTGGEFTVTIRPLKSLNIMFSSNVYNKIIDANLGMYSIYKNDFSFDNRTTIVYTLKKLYTIQLMGYYKSTALNIQGSSDPMYYINATIKADLFKRVLSLRFGVQDIFNWQKDLRLTNTPTITSTSNQKSMTQFVTAGITFRFGKIELESKSKAGGQSQGGGAPGM